MKTGTMTNDQLAGQRLMVGFEGTEFNEDLKFLINRLNVGGIDNDYVTLTFRRRIGADDLTYIVEFSDDLSSWIADGIFVDSEPAGDGLFSGNGAGVAQLLERIRIAERPHLG